jgi:hypothetical protein
VQCARQARQVGSRARKAELIIFRHKELPLAAVRVCGSAGVLGERGPSCISCIPCAWCFSLPISLPQALLRPLRPCGLALDWRHLNMDASFLHLHLEQPCRAHLILSFDWSMWSLQSGLSATGIPSQPIILPRLCRGLKTPRASYNLAPLQAANGLVPTIPATHSLIRPSPLPNLPPPIT